MFYSTASNARQRLAVRAVPHLGHPVVEGVVRSRVQGIGTVQQVVYAGKKGGNKQGRK
jgi:hypothetical protein